MASHVVVVDTTARRATVKTTPGKYLSDVLQEATTKLSLKGDYTLKHNNKTVDLSTPFRLSGLPPGAKLDLVQASRSAAVVSVALQLPESEKSARLTQKFPSITSLWQILRVFESTPNTNYNFTQRGAPSVASGAGRLNYEMPCLNLMGREAANFTDLQKTLSQFGFTSGSALLRLQFRNSGKPLEEAMAEISQYFQEVEEPAPSQPAEVKGAHSGITGEGTSVLDPEKAAPTKDIAGTENPPEPMEDVTPTPPPAEAQPTLKPEPSSLPPETVTGLDHRPLVVFAPPSANTPQAARQTYNPNDYVPTIDHAKSHQARLIQESRNKRLASDQELEEQQKAKEEKLNAIDSIILRVRLPDQAQVETSFGKLETSANVYEFVRNLLAQSDAGFSLRYAGPKGQVAMKDGPERLVKDLGFTGRTLINLVWDDTAIAKMKGKPSLKQEWASKAQQIKVDMPKEEPVEKKKSGPSVLGGNIMGKKKGNDDDKENKLKKILGKGLFKK